MEACLAKETAPVEICCDESGNDGENLMEGTTSVFAHGSVNLDMEAAEGIIAKLRSNTGSRAAEFKSKDLIKPHHIGHVLELLAPDGPLAGRASIHLTDKSYFVVGKVIDLLVEELSHERGENLYNKGKARKMAYDLFEFGPRAFQDPADWVTLLKSFTSLMRLTQRSGEKATVSDFFSTVDKMRHETTKRRVGDILQLVWESRHHAEDFQESIRQGEAYRSLDPLIAAIPQTARTWYELLAEPLALVHDQQKTLDEALTSNIVRYVSHWQREYGYRVPPIPLRDIRQADSKTDARIQVADVVAGVGRLAATSALNDEANPELLQSVRPFLDRNSLWGHNSSWVALTGRRLPG